MQCLCFSRTMTTKWHEIIFSISFLSFQISYYICVFVGTKLLLKTGFSFWKFIFEREKYIRTIYFSNKRKKQNSFCIHVPYQCVINSQIPSLTRSYFKNYIIRFGVCDIKVEVSVKSSESTTAADNTY